jgi:hypothetical protein
MVLILNVSGILYKGKIQLLIQGKFPGRAYPDLPGKAEPLGREKRSTGTPKEMPDKTPVFGARRGFLHQSVTSRRGSWEG